MSSPFFTAGAVLSAVHDFCKHDDRIDDRLALAYLSRFDVQTTCFDMGQHHEIDENTAPLAVLHNMICRGVPTISTAFLEEKLAEKYSILKKRDAEHRIFFELQGFKDENKPLPIDITGMDAACTMAYMRSKADSTFEAGFLDNYVEILGAEALYVLDQQVPLSELLPSEKHADFHEQRCDYLFSLPKAFQKSPAHPLLFGIVIEMDGHPDHHNSQLDKRRDAALLEAGYYTYRITTEDASGQRKSCLSNLIKAWQKSMFAPFKSSGSKVEPSWALIHIPMAAARVQRCLLEFLLSHPEHLNDEFLDVGLVYDELNFREDDLALIIEEFNVLTAQFRVLTDQQVCPIIRARFVEREQAHSRPELQSLPLVFDLSTRARRGDIPAYKAPNSVVIRNAPLYKKEIERCFLTGCHVPYKSFGVYENSEWKSENEHKARINALECMLQNLFRMQGFRPGQLPILNRALQAESVIGLLPTGGGKSLTYQFAALMQPGVCLVVDPILSLMQDQERSLREQGIDALTVINSRTAPTPAARREKEEQIAAGKALFAFVSPERMLSEEFRSFVKMMPMPPRPVYFSYAVIDEAHCVSEWGHDFRTSYLSIAENCIRFCTIKPARKQRIPLFGLTATASYDVLSDIGRELSGNDPSQMLSEEATVRHNQQKRDELHFKIQPYVASTNKKEPNEWDYKEAMAEAKRGAIVELLEEHGKNVNQGAGLIFCPHRSHYFGITDRFKGNDAAKYVGIYDHLTTLKNAPVRADDIGYFMGSGEMDSSTGDRIAKETEDNQTAFLEGRKKLLVATKAFGMGIDKNNVRLTIHLNYPGSIEGFLQEAGRAGRDRKDAYSYILFGKDENSRRIEEQVNTYFHENSYRGVKKEQAIIHELLYQIHAPDQSFFVANELEQALDGEFSVGIWKSRAGNRYISVDHNSMQVWNILIGDHNFVQYIKSDDEDAEAILEHLYELLSPHGIGATLWKWLNTSPSPSPGLFQLIDAPSCPKEKYGGTFTLYMQNNTRERIDKMQRFVKWVVGNALGTGVEIQEQLMYNFVEGKKQALDFDDLINKINHEYKSKTLDFREASKRWDKKKKQRPGTALRNLETYYNQHRDKNDTEKAMYRIRILGLIDDYTVDYRKKSFTVYYSKKSTKYLTSRLKTYLEKFFSDGRVKQELKKAKETKGENLPEKYLNYLVEFGYEHIAKKRKQAIGAMRKACEYGLDKGNNSRIIAEYMDLYLNSKYARDTYEHNGANVSMPYRLDKGKAADAKNIWFYINLIDEDGDSEINNLKHLRGATMKMMIDSPDNFVLRILSAYATLMLEYKNQRLQAEAEENLSRGLEIMEETYGYTEARLEKEIFTRLRKELLQRRPDLETYYTLDFESFRLNKMLETARQATALATEINEILIPEGVY